MERVLLLGGSFDPIHHGHLIIARSAAETLDAARVLLVPAARPPHKPDRFLAPPQDRLAMCRLAVADDPLFEVSDWELTQPGPNYTLHTVRHFLAALGAGRRLFWLIGADSLAELASWHRVGELADACTIVTAARPGFDPGDLAHLRGCLRDDQIEAIRAHVLRSPLIEITSTEIRSRLAAGRSVRYLLPPAVEGYIRDRGLYRMARRAAPAQAVERPPHDADRVGEPPGQG